MIRIEETEIVGWRHAIRGMRNALNSWERSDTVYGTCWGVIDGHQCCDDYGFCIGRNDMELMMTLRNAGTDHRKYMRMIVVFCDITAPLYWWKEYDTYKVGTVANSCSTMHKIHAKEFTFVDFSTEHLGYMSIPTFEQIIQDLNAWRDAYNNYKEMPESFRTEYSKKEVWENMIQLLPTSYNQKRTVMLNYEVLSNIYKSRKNHKLDEWRELCKWIESGQSYVINFLITKTNYYKNKINVCVTVIMRAHLVDIQV